MHRAGLFILITITILLAASNVSASCTPQFTKISDANLSKPVNSVIWAMLSYKGHLYAGTSNRFGGSQIHRYDGTTWENVVVGGLGNQYNQGIRHMAEYKGKLYASTVNAVTGAEIWRTEDGVTWETVMTGGFGTRTIDTVRSLKEFKGYLYAGASDDGTNDRPGQLWRTTDGTTWEPVSLDGLGDNFNDSFHRMEIFRGFMYVSIRHTRDGQPRVWRTEDGVNFREVVGPNSIMPEGFGIANNFTLYDLRAFRGYLYAGTGNFDGFSLHRTADGINWEEIGRDGMGSPGNGQQNITNQGNNFAWRFQVFEDKLWLGIHNYQGARLWNTENGLDWTEVAGPDGIYATAGFGNPYNWGVRSLEVYNDKLYVGTAQCITPSCIYLIPGAEVLEFNGEACETP